MQSRLVALLRCLARLPPSTTRAEAEAIVVECLIELDDAREREEPEHPTSSGVFRIY